MPVPVKGSEESNAQSPEEVPRLRDGTFFARHADSFKYEGRFYNLILAIDGKRRALKLYSDLSRQSKTQSGLRFSDQRGVILCSQGIRVCQYNQILDHQGMNGWSDLAQGLDHFSLFIDGPFNSSRTAICQRRRHLAAQRSAIREERGEFPKPGEP